MSRHRSRRQGVNTDPHEPTAIEGGYTVRFYRPGDHDREGFLSLYESVFGGASDAWLDWKYTENPYVDHVPIILAEKDGEIAGAKPAFALRMRVGSESALALQPCDTMVHAEHRRRGLYSAMLSYQKEAYRSGEAAFFFNFPNPASMAGSLEAGWRPATKVPTYYRIQEPAALAGSSIKDGRGRQLGARARSLAGLATPLARTYLRVRDRLRDVPEETTVERHPDVPAGTFASLYERDVPEYVHALRTQQFYEWRFENPHWHYSAYTAHRGDRQTHKNREDRENRENRESRADRAGAPIAGVITARGTDGEASITHLLDVVPMTLGSLEAEGIAAILDRVVREHADSDVLAIRGRTIPPSLLARYGFHADRSFPLSSVASQSTLVTRPTDVPDGDESGEKGAAWTVAGVDLLAASNWGLTLSELDTA